jgi:hypothetical protein
MVDENHHAKVHVLSAGLMLCLIGITGQLLLPKIHMDGKRVYQALTRSTSATKPDV